MAAADTKCKHEEVKVKFGVGPFRTKKWKSRCKQREAIYNYDMTTTPMLYNLNNEALHPTITSVLAKRSHNANANTISWPSFHSNHANNRENILETIFRNTCSSMQLLVSSEPQSQSS